MSNELSPLELLFVAVVRLAIDDAVYPHHCPKHERAVLKGEAQEFLVWMGITAS